jgi:hypothetical protein
MGARPWRYRRGERGGWDVVAGDVVLGLIYGVYIPLVSGSHWAIDGDDPPGTQRWQLHTYSSRDDAAAVLWERHVAANPAAVMLVPEVNPCAGQAYASYDGTVAHDGSCPNAGKTEVAGHWYCGRHVVSAQNAQRQLLSDRIDWLSQLYNRAVLDYLWHRLERHDDCEAQRLWDAQAALNKHDVDSACRLLDHTARPTTVNGTSHDR